MDWSSCLCAAFLCALQPSAGELAALQNAMTACEAAPPPSPAPGTFFLPRIIARSLSFDLRASVLLGAAYGAVAGAGSGAAAESKGKQPSKGTGAGKAKGKLQTKAAASAKEPHQPRWQRPQLESLFVQTLSVGSLRGLQFGRLSTAACQMDGAVVAALLAAAPK